MSNFNVHIPDTEKESLQAQLNLLIARINGAIAHARNDEHELQAIVVAATEIRNCAKRLLDTAKQARRESRQRQARHLAELNGR